jgi:hypothetical protein
MKKISYLLFAGIMFGAAGVASAQVQLAVGLKGGLNFASLNTNSSIKANYGNRTGYHGGAYVMFKFTKVAIQPEIIFSRQGQTFTFNSKDYNSNYDYINIPIMVKFYLVGGLNLQAGPQFGFLASSKGAVINNFNSSNASVSTGQDLKNFMKSSDVSIGVGFGWDLPLGLNVGARYNIGVSDINKYSGNQAPPGQVSSLGTSQAKNQVIQVSVGYRLFKIGS